MYIRFLYCVECANLHSIIKKGEDLANYLITNSVIDRMEMEANEAKNAHCTCLFICYINWPVAP